MEKYTTKLGDKICEHTATSSIGLRHICKQINMPYSTVTSWIYDHKHELYQKYAHAKQMQLYHLEEEILEIADDSTNDYMTIVKNGKKVVIQNRESIARSRLRIQARISLITRLAPRTRRIQLPMPVHEEVDITVKNTPAPKKVKKAPTTRAHATPPSPSERAGERSFSRAYATPPSPSERAGERSPSSSPKNTSKPSPKAPPAEDVPYACSVLAPGERGVVCR